MGAAVLTVGLAGAALVLTNELFHTPFFAVVCGAAILWGLIGLLDRRVQLALSDEGIRYRRWGPTVVPWHEFSGFRWVTWRHSRQLQLVARRPSELPEGFSRLGRLNHLCCRLLRMPAFSIAVPPLAIAEFELEAWVSRHLPEDRAGPAT